MVCNFPYNYNYTCIIIIGTVYGQGVYFARDAKYSHTYAKPDATGERRMYYARVLTGEYTVGDSTMKVPPIKKNSTDEIPYDSTVDRNIDPSIFVVYKDAQNYPAYVVCYK